VKHTTALILALATLGFTATAFAGESKTNTQPTPSHMNSMMKSTTMPMCKGATVYAVPEKKEYYMKGMTMYGHAKGGTYMCQSAANAKGYHKVKS